MRRPYIFPLCLIVLLTAFQNAAVASTAPTHAHLEAYVWHLSEATDARGERIDALFVEGRPPLAVRFTQGQLGVLNLCNAMGAGYRLQGSHLFVVQGERTVVGCRDEVAEQESRAIALITHSSSATLTQADDGALAWRTAHGEVLVFLPEPTPETRYGSPGETLYLEVASRTAPCASPTGAQCLQVREVHYGSNGSMLASEGEFVSVPWQIEGFSHEDGLSNVLLVKRFAISGPKPSWAYVSKGALRTTRERAEE